MTNEIPTGPPQATAAHARARSARLLAQLRRSVLFKATASLGILALITGLPALFGHAPLSWFGFFRSAFTIALFLLLVRVVYLLAVETLWLLRNRLILAYVFMGVVPVLLIAGMLAIGAYMFYGQYASYLLLSELNDHTRNVGAVNQLTVHELSRRPDRAADGPELSRYYASYYFPRGYGGVHSFFYQDGAVTSPESKPMGALPTWIKPGFVGLINRPEGYDIASLGSSTGTKPEQVLTMYALSRANLDTLAKPLGEVSLGLTGFADISGTGAGRPRGPSPVSASQQSLPPASSFLDIRITSFAFIPVTNWETGKTESVIATINSRPSLLNDQLFASLQGSSIGPNTGARWPLVLLAVVGIGFLIIEFFSLMAGIRLTRTITGTVHDLYEGTVHINRGEFDHRIPVRTRDQLAALALSFNAMTSSIQRLLAEQRQKQNLENELTIAHEVQAQLFPRLRPDIAGLEVTGRCLAARVVSGDYFDFQQVSPTLTSLALGDISGKGISAALLMATIVSAMRAYQPSLADRAVGVAVGAGAEPEPVSENLATVPVRLLERLNRQLFHSTPPEKYVTLFYGLYDAALRQLHYTCAGHLPPAIVGARGGVRRLDRGGMVAGLFEEVSYDAGMAELEPGDLIAAWSDGITEPENEYGVEFGETRLLQMIEMHRTRPLVEILDTVLSAVKEWSGTAEQADDITLVLARVLE